VNRVFFLLFLFLLAGCRKDPPVIPPDEIPPVVVHPPRPMLKTIANSDSSGVTRRENFFYDSLWRLVVHSDLTAANLYVDSFEYWASGISRNNFSYVTLRSNGLTETEWAGSWYSDKHYSFNTDSQLTNYYSMSGSASFVYDGNHNATEKHVTTEANPPNYIYYNYYYTYNTHPNTIGNYNQGKYHLGKSSVNLIEREDWDWNYNAFGYNEKSFRLYNYTYNDSGWVSKLEINNTDIHTNYIDSVTVIYDTTRSVNTFDYTYY
jgi:hypothetical protein